MCMDPPNLCPTPPLPSFHPSFCSSLTLKQTLLSPPDRRWINLHTKKHTWIQRKWIGKGKCVTFVVYALWGKKTVGGSDHCWRHNGKGKQKKEQCSFHDHENLPSTEAEARRREEWVVLKISDGRTNTRPFDESFHKSFILAVGTTVCLEWSRTPPRVTKISSDKLLRSGKESTKQTKVRVSRKGDQKWAIKKTDYHYTMKYELWTVVCNKRGKTRKTVHACVWGIGPWDLELALHCLPQY